MPSLVVKVTWGPERAETMLQAFTVAATAVASGVEVSVWLSGEATTAAIAGAEDVTLAYSAPLSQLRDAVLAGGTLTVCSQCALRRGLKQEQLLPGTRIAGAATFVEETVADGARVLVY